MGAKMTVEIDVATGEIVKVRDGRKVIKAMPIEDLTLFGRRKASMKEIGMNNPIRAGSEVGDREIRSKVKKVDTLSLVATQHNPNCIWLVCGNCYYLV